MFRVVNTIDNPEYLPVLQNYMQTISGHRAENFVNLKVERALQWYILYDTKWIVGFCGVQIPDSWKDKGVARIMFRTYLAPEVRGKGMTITRHNWNYSGKLMVDFCLSRDLIPVISREETGSRNAIKNVHINANRTGPGKWFVPRESFYTCRGEPNDDPKCWQKLVVLHTDHDSRILTLPCAPDNHTPPYTHSISKHGLCGKA